MEVTRLAAAEGTVNLSHPVMFMGGGVLGGWEGFGEGVGDEGAEERADGDLRALRRGEGVRGVRLVGEGNDFSDTLRQASGSLNHWRGRYQFAHPVYSGLLYEIVTSFMMSYRWILRTTSIPWITLPNTA